MRSENKPEGQRTFIEEARRAQIIAATIEVLAEAGFAGASLAAIAKHAGISKGVISYHFAGKNELMEEVVEQVYTRIAEHVVSRMQSGTTAKELLRTHILAVAEHMRDNRAQVKALGEIFTNLRDDKGGLRYGMHTDEVLYQGLETIYQWGQENGEFRPFDRRIMAVTHNAAVNAMFAYWVITPGHDLDAHANELADLFERAVT
ncbi:TetR/AcrR family transcriptional regulator [Nonomuraea typhae]|uniref:TetR/AcrR family transcriptional regulator n=1 Tax=Nonomuraea typhae TaxID=2603600 RepID=UPI0012FC6AD8|nr:TetR/AcrR family transcriptional regulator [Nonomuraea typhae]